MPSISFCQNYSSLLFVVALPFSSTRFEPVNVNSPRILPSVLSPLVTDFERLVPRRPYLSRVVVAFFSSRNAITSLSETFRRSRMRPQIAPTRCLRYVRKIARQRSFAPPFIYRFFFYFVPPLLQADKFVFRRNYFARRNALFPAASDNDDNASSLIFLFLRDARSK